MSNPPPLSLSNWQLGPHNRHTFGRVREIVPTARVAAGQTPLELETDTDTDTDTLDLGTPVELGGTPVGTIGSLLSETYTDGFIVVREGRIVAEHYPGDLDAERNHALFSVSKTLVGTVCAILAEQGVLDVDELVTTYVPALAASGYRGATVRHLLDMRSGIKFSEEYDDLSAEVRRIDQAVGWLPRDDADAPTRLYDYLPRLVAERPHGGHFDYRSCETDVLGWVCEAASGLQMPELLSRLLWSRIAEHDMDAGVDIDRTVFFDGGLTATLRDLARFGELVRRRGHDGRAQVVPASWIDDALAGAHDSRQAFASGPLGDVHPGWMYRNQFWVPYGDRRVLLCLGIHGQMVHVDLDAQVVVAKLSSWPTPLDAGLDAKTDALTQAAVRAVSAVAGVR
ncbi:MAG TPA: serine hydrolase [Nocardioides sp.]|uniref:serine hydrolase domain-containing protein n=1 Tax=Nocardioides sp. TaxID=35761 RepID=UPI002ED99A47